MFTIALSIVWANKTPSVCEDNVAVSDFGDGVLANLSCSERDSNVDKLAYPVDDARFGFSFR